VREREKVSSISDRAKLNIEERTRFLNDGDKRRQRSLCCERGSSARRGRDQDDYEEGGNGRVGRDLNQVKREEREETVALRCEEKKRGSCILCRSEKSMGIRNDRPLEGGVAEEPPRWTVGEGKILFIASKGRELERGEERTISPAPWGEGSVLLPR